MSHRETIFDGALPRQLKMNISRSINYLVVMALLVSLGNHKTSAQESPDSKSADNAAQTFSIKDYKFEEFMVPMRDGIKLKTYLAIPRKSKEPLPFLMVRTPYGSSGRPATEF